MYWGNPSEINQLILEKHIWLDIAKPQTKMSGYKYSNFFFLQSYGLAILKLLCKHCGYEN